MRLISEPIIRVVVVFQLFQLTYSKKWHLAENTTNPGSYHTRPNHLNHVHRDARDAFAHVAFDSAQNYCTNSV